MNKELINNPFIADPSPLKDKPNHHNGGAMGHSTGSASFARPDPNGTEWPPCITRQSIDDQVCGLDSVKQKAHNCGLKQALDEQNRITDHAKITVLQSQHIQQLEQQLAVSQAECVMFKRILTLVEILAAKG